MTGPLKDGCMAVLAWALWGHVGRTSGEGPTNGNQLPQHGCEGYRGVIRAFVTPSYDKIAAYRRQISIFSLSITRVMVGGWSLSQLPFGWRWGTPCTSAAWDKPLGQNLVHFFNQEVSSNLQIQRYYQSVRNLYEESMRVAAFSQIPCFAICKTNLINNILIFIITIVVIVVVASLCVSWQMCWSRHSSLIVRNTGIADLTLLNFDCSSCVHANWFAALPAVCRGKIKRFDSVTCSSRGRIVIVMSTSTCIPLHAGLRLHV